MMAHKQQFLHELLKEDQEPFHLKSYIADRRSQLNKLSQTIQIKKRKQIIAESSTKRSNNLCKHACFLSFQNSPDVRKSPLFDFPSPAPPPRSPIKSPNGAVFLHIPSRTAALLVEAAMRIQKQQQQSKSKSKSQNGKNAAFGLFGSFLKRLKDRSKSKKRAIGNSDIRVSEKLEESAVGMSCSCNSRRLSSADWTESIEEDKSLDLETCSNSSVSESSERINSDFGLLETRYCFSPFTFSLHKSPSTSGIRTPDFCSPAASPSRHVAQEKENHESRNLNNVQTEEEEEKEQCSPVSILDPPFEEDDENESGDAEEDDYDPGCSYANVQRAKQQLLNRLRRFERLAELDPMELERKLLEGSDDDDLGEREESDDEDEPFSLYKKHSVDTFVTEAFNQYNNSRKVSADMKRLVSDLIIEEKSEEIISSGNKEVVLGRVGNRLDSWKEVEFDTIDMMIDLDFKRGLDGWKKFPEQVEEVAAEMEIEIYGLLMEELSEEMFYMDGEYQEQKLVECI
ncbi:hypothetical protein BUALT_Bualt09G0088800 [Buddleja alternifolia]|uniref:DUF4378 domain-containing protein n=1 Tax=Buddleja alternifolia TaxID=168488 RepID=A0AAV6X7R5_9LAMI|nr:hypothetical protein BUALT_Bualt09G0088800 [Buddleja alternifolia]